MARGVDLCGVGIAPGVILALLNSFTDGCQKMISANIRRAIELVCGSAALFGSLALGYGLWGFGALLSASFTAGIAVLLLSQRALIGGLWRGLLKPRDKLAS